jgi:phosphopantetheinyl transferase
MIPRDTCLTRYARLDELLAGTADPDWLRGDELREFDRIHDRSRQQQWLAGRLLSRALLVETFSLDSGCQLQILSRDDRNLGVSPRVLLEGRELDCGLSIAHSQRGVLVAVSAARSISVGVDLCDALVATPGFLRLWFTAAEQNWIQADSSRAATAWATKEAVYKAMGQGAAWNPREIELLSAADGGYACRYQGRPVESLTLVVCELDGHVAAIASVAKDVKAPIEQSPCNGVAVLCDSLDVHPVCGSSHD